MDGWKYRFSDRNSIKDTRIRFSPGKQIPKEQQLGISLNIASSLIGKEDASYIASYLVQASTNNKIDIVQVVSSFMDMVPEDQRAKAQDILDIIRIDNPDAQWSE